MLKKNKFMFIIWFCSAKLFAHGLPYRANDPFSENDLAHGYHIHAPIEYALGEGMHYGLHREIPGHSEIAFAPIFSINGDKFSRLINLQSLNQSMQDGSQTGYLYKQNKSITVALGLDFHLAWGMPVASFSLMPLSTRSTYVERHISKKEDRKKLKKKVTIPSNSEELAEWRIGDRLFYKKTTSLTFMTDGGLEPFVYTGGVLNASGIWIIGFEKTSTSTMRFSVTKSKVFGLGYEFDGLFFALGLEHFRGKDRLFQYDIDMTNPEAVKVLPHLMDGKFVKAQKLAKVENSGVTTNDNSISRFHGPAKFRIFTLPFLWGASHIAMKPISADADLHDENKETKFSSTILNRKNTAGLMSQHKSKMKASFANLEIKENEEKEFAAAYSWTFEKGKIDADDINEKLDELGSQIGLHSQLHFSDLSSEDGYAKIQFLNQLSMASIIQLVNSSKLGLITWQKLHKKSLKDYFNRKVDPVDNINGRSFKNQLRKGDRLVKKILKELAKAKSYMDEKNYKKFTKSIATAIELIHQKPAIFECFMRRIDGYKLHLGIEGEQMLMQQKELHL